MSFVQKNTVTAGLGVTTLASSITGVTAGNLLVLIVAWDVNGGTAGPSLNATAISNGWKVGQNPAGTVAANNSAWATGTSIFYLPNTPSGSVSVTVTFPNTSRANTLLAEFSGYATSNPLDQTATAATAGATTLTVTSGSTTTATELVIVGIATTFVFGNSNEGLTDPPTGYTSLAVLQDNNTYASFEFAYKEVVSTGTQSANWTWSQSGEGVAALSTFSTSGASDTLMGQAVM